MRRLGGFFIKRKLDSAAGKDVLYRKCLQEVHVLYKLWKLQFSLYNYSTVHGALLVG